MNIPDSGDIRICYGFMVTGHRNLSRRIFSLVTTFFYISFVQSSIVINSLGEQGTGRLVVPMLWFHILLLSLSSWCQRAAICDYDTP